MKKIINGKVYDTKTAEDLGGWDRDRADRLNYIGEWLYRKRTGEFFLYGYGGALTKYAVSCGNNSWGGSEQIIPLSWDAARQWAEENLDAEEYEAIFGEVIEDDTRVTVTLSLSAQSVELAKREASKQGVGLSAYIDQLIRNA